MSSVYPSSRGVPKTEDDRVKRSSRAPQKLSRKNPTNSPSHSTKYNTETKIPNKVPPKTSGGSKIKTDNSNTRVIPNRRFYDQKVSNVEVNAWALQESFELDDERGPEHKNVEEVKEIDVLNGAPKNDNETVDTEDSSLDGDTRNPYRKIEEMELRIEGIEQELREVAALEVSLYLVVPDHGGSVNKVHMPARRLSRLHIHACKCWSGSKHASFARNTISGIALVVKSCGSDVSRLTFWLSNVVVLREIITGAFGSLSLSSPVKKLIASNAGDSIDCISSSTGWKRIVGNKSMRKTGILQSVDGLQEIKTFTSSLEKIESWIFSRIVESVWWQILTPHMQSSVDTSYKRKVHNKLSGQALGDQRKGNFSIELWKGAFLDAFSRLCPVRAGGHECGCLSVLAKMVMKQCLTRLDVAMFNAILRQSANDIPTDPVSDPIVDPKVLPIPAGDLSFGSGAQLKHSIGNWSRWLTDTLGMKIDNSIDEAEGHNDDKQRRDVESICFHLLSSLSDILMLPKDMLLDKSIRNEVCPSIRPSLITRILCNFTPDEFCPDPVPAAILEQLNVEASSERLSSDDDVINSFPYAASPVVYCLPSAADVALKVVDGGGKEDEFMRNTGDGELDDFDYYSTNARFELLRQVWSV